MSEILIIDDDPALRRSFEKLLIGEGYQIASAVSGEEALEKLAVSSPDLVISDVRLPGIDGIETFRRIHARKPRLPVIIMTAFGTTETAIEATKLGAYDYILKPFEIPDMLKLIEKALAAGRLSGTPVYLDDDPGPGGDAIIGRSPAMQEVYKAIGRAAPTDATVLIRGESGTGKELAARALYQHSLRADKPFLVINCVAIPETLLESELFGYEKGAFTGAVHRRIGKIEQAAGGTLFLDEIGDMPLSIQAKILRMLQEKSIERLGGRSTVPVDVRIIAATNRNLEAAIEEGRFREDLYYRLNVVALNLPPLRERKGDVPLLARWFLNRTAGVMGTHNPGLTEEAEAFLEKYHWPGNVRELANAMEKCLIFSRGQAISGQDVKTQAMGLDGPREKQPQGLEETLRFWARERLAQGGEYLLVSMVDQLESLIISEALSMTGGNRTRAAELLGLSRPTLLARIEKYKLSVRTTVSPETGGRL